MKTKYMKVPYTVIEAASAGDHTAIQFVLKNYQSYISSLCMKTVYLENGAAKVCVDDLMYRRLETKLIAKMTMFDMNY